MTQVEVSQSTRADISIGVCVTTRHRPEILEACLRGLADAGMTLAHVVVSDDSTNTELQAATAQVVERFAGVKYVIGPKKGVCANRNFALSHLGAVDYVAYLDDDGLVRSDYFAVARATYERLPSIERMRTILTGTRVNSREGGCSETTVGLDFRCYFVHKDVAEVAGASYAVYPRRLFVEDPWDERLFFGYEDAELSLRARSHGYAIVHVPSMVVTDLARGQSTVNEGVGRVSEYEFHGEAARLYVGVKRYREIEPSLPKLAVFVLLYFGQISWALAKRRSLHRLPGLVRHSKVLELLG